MSFALAPYCILARNRRNWHVSQLGDGRLQLDLGLFAVALHREAFHQAPDSYLSAM